jgi:hypothetical protein
MNDPSSHSTASWFRRRRKLIVILLVILSSYGSLWGAYGFYSYRINRELVEAEAEADRLDPGWRLEELEAKRKQLPDERNGALPILAARKLLSEGWAATPLENARASEERGGRLRNVNFVLGWQLPPVLLNSEQTAILRAKLEPTTDALAEARKLADLPEGRFPISYGADPIHISQDSQEARAISFLLAARSVLLAQDKDLEEAMTCVRAGINASRAVGDEPLLNTLLIRVSCRSVALSTLERTLAQGEPSETSLGIFQQLLEDEEALPLLFNAARGERACENKLLISLEKGDVTFAQATDRQRTGLAEELNDQLKKPLLPRKRAATLRWLNQWVEIAKLPLEQQEAHEKLLGARNPPGVDVYRVSREYRFSQAMLRCAIASLAVERYRQKNNRWPESLADLKANQLAETPLDPFDGNPLRYRVIDDGVVVYSIGPDHTDDGGKIDREKLDTSGTDIGIRLWNVNQRRQPPKP